MSIHSLIELSLKTPNRGESAHALGHVVEEWRADYGSATTALLEPGPDSESQTRYQVTFVADGPAHLYPSYFDQLSPAEDYEVKKIERFTREGVGTPMRALRENRGREAVERFYPEEAITREVTAVIHQRGKRRGVEHLEIELLCAHYYDTVVINGKREVLAADFSVALASLLERTKDLSKAEFTDLLTHRPSRKPQLYLMEPYDSRKEPLVMVHGLLDSPLGWAAFTNRLRADPDVRKRYQIWHFLYNTSAPALYSGRLLRTQYRAVRKEFDPQLRNPASKRATLLTHSMGGIVARGLITEPGDAFWDAAFTRPPSALKLEADDREALKEAFLWKAEPTVKRVIFLAVPHRGSRYADNPLGKLGQVLVKPPNRFREFYERVSAANPGAFTPEYAALGEGKLDSVSALSPKQPTLQILADLPLGYDPIINSVIGDRGKGGELEDSTDGIVPYWSSHLDYSDTETIVPYGHSMLKEPEVIEIVRELLLE